MSYITEQELTALQLTELSRLTPFTYGGVRYGQLSIARYTGFIMVNKQEYVYIPTTDELIRADVVKWLAKHRKQMKKADKKDQKILTF